MLPPLPIDPVLPKVVALLRDHPAIVLQAPPGAGKTTRVPPAILDAAMAGERRIIVLEPRRVAARAAARRMSAEHGTSPGDLFGWHVRFKRQANRNTRLLVVTPGILLRMLMDDPFLESVGVIIFDEFHERGLETDLALGMVRLVQGNVRPDLKLVVMSATIQSGDVAVYLGDSPVINSEGRTYPVEIKYEPKREDDRWPLATAKAVARVLDRTPGDVLAFLPGVGEIRAAAESLEATIGDEVMILPLHGDLPAEEQDRALLPQGRRKIVLATNVAETSITVEGVTAVIDSGLARQLIYDPSVGLDRLELVNISRASADQRAGRAGRTQPGMCVRLWSEVSHRSRPADTEPEIRRVDLAGAMLQLLSFGERVETFPWLDPPREQVIRQAHELLELLGAVQVGKLTDLGWSLARLPVHPRLGRLLLAGARLGEPRRAALAAALLSERDPFPRGPATHTTPSDLLDRMEALDGGASPLGSVNRGAARNILRARDQLARLIQELGVSATSAPAADAPGSPEESVGRALLAAFPDRLCRRREPGSPRGVMVGGRGVKLAPSSGVTQAELFLAVDVDAGQAETLVRQASAIERAWLPRESLHESIDVEFDDNTGRVVAWKRTRFADLVLDERSANAADGAAVSAVLIEAALRNLERVLPSADSPAGQFRTRVRCLRAWMPELNLPEMSDADLRDVLDWLAPRRRSLDDLKRADWEVALRSKLTHAQRQAVEREAPERIEVPSGSRIALTYEEGRPPILAVRIQELFGLADTPRVAGGRVKVLVHLLAPNYRPQQVTDDLASFWANTYPVVRKELRARYPKHSWPEDPLTAEARSRPRRRG
ncbi:MAG TPA: ATP-dependent helicase HrpB [Gemmataceae bacterium]|nr:ATP-dependent helicase HrpB [Gemmataceae bacterium]